MSDDPMPETIRSTKPRPRSLALVLIVALMGPVIGLLSAKLGLVLAPPWISLTGRFYLLLACLGFPLAIIASLLGWLGRRGMLATLFVTILAGLFMFVIVGPALPYGLTDCQPAAGTPSELRYSCVSTSSDNSDDPYNFTLEGPPGWPIMRIVYPQH